MSKLKPKTIKKKVLKIIKNVPSGAEESILNMEYIKIKKLFFAFFSQKSEDRGEEEMSHLTVEVREKKILSQAVLIMKRIYYDPEAVEVFERNMGNPVKDIQKTDDFLEFIIRIVLK